MSDEQRDDQAGAEPDGTAEVAEVAEAADVGVATAQAGAEAPAGPRDLGALKEILEALIFVHRGILPPKTVREVLGEEYTADEVAAGFAALREDYEKRGGALVLLEVAGGYQFGTRDDLAPWIQKLDFYEHHRHLSRPTLETLAIIAYKQPVTRAEIEAIRGVNVERIVRTLIERKLVRILGHKDVPGKPMVLGTTKEFLELFGINSLADLPPLKEFLEPPAEEGIEEESPLPDAAGQGGAAPAAGTGESTDGAGGEPAGGQGDDSVEQGSAGRAEAEDTGEAGGDAAPGGEPEPSDAQDAGRD